MLKNRFFSIRFKIIALFSLLILILFITISLVFYKGIDDTIRSSTEKEYRIITDETANKIERFLFERYGDIQVLANNSILHNTHISFSEKVKFLDKVRFAYNTYDFILLLDKKGKPVIRSGVIPQKSHFEDLFEKTKLHKVYVSSIDKLNDHYGMFFCASVYDSKGNFYGVIIERMNLNSIQEIKKKVKTAKKGYAFLMNEHNQFLFIHDISDQFIIPQNSDSGIKYVNFRGDDFIYVYKRIKLYSTVDENWYLVLKSYKREAFSILHQVWNYTLTVIFISILAISLLAWLVACFITKPFKRLIEETELLAKGEQITPINLESKDEIGTMANFLNTIILNMNTMTEQILETSGQIVDVKEIKDYFNKLTDEVSTGIFTLNAKGQIISVNKSATDLLKMESKELIGYDIFLHKHQKELIFTEILIECFTQQKEFRKEPVDIPDEQGIIKKYLFSNIFQKDKAGRLLGVVVLFRKLDDFIRFEESITRAKTLNAIGLMSAGISHEIRNPLTSIKGYAQYIKSGLDQNHELQNDLDIIIYEVNRLNNLINRFLEFAKPVNPDCKPTRINQLIQNTVLLLNKEMLQQQKIKLDLADDMIINIDEEQIEQALLNLLINAVQATDDTGNIIIRSYYEYKHFFVIRIEDNGTGIKPEDADHLFEPFFTTKEKGSGLGLAICARIIQDHNSQLEYHPAKDKGSVFLIKFPENLIIQEKS